jgi:hypothetical protein
MVDHLRVDGMLSIRVPYGGRLLYLFAFFDFAPPRLGVHSSLTTGVRQPYPTFSHRSFDSGTDVLARTRLQTKLRCCLTCIIELSCVRLLPENPWGPVASSQKHLTISALTTLWYPSAVFGCEARFRRSCPCLWTNVFVACLMYSWVYYLTCRFQSDPIFERKGYRHLRGVRLVLPATVRDTPTGPRTDRSEGRGWGPHPWVNHTLESSST